VRQMLDDAGLRYELEPTLVRGLDYYARTVYEFTSKALGAAQSAVGGGGRYDGLVQQLGGRPTPASGWAAGIERILLAAPDQPQAPMHVDLFVAVSEPEASRPAFALATEARRAGLNVQQELASRSLKGQLKQADRIGARYVALIGTESLVGLKNMESGEQTEHELRSVIPTILRGKRLP
jgi:histidyl-tRNA synthetase